jgi:hypothetical protein
LYFERIMKRMPQAKAWRTMHGHTSKGDTLDTPWEVIDRCTLRWSTTR